MSRRLLGSDVEIQAEPSSVRWLDFAYDGSWAAYLEPHDIAFTLDSTKLILTLDADCTGGSVYSLDIRIVSEQLPTVPAAPLKSTQGEEHPALGTDLKNVDSPDPDPGSI